MMRESEPVNNSISKARNPEKEIELIRAQLLKAEEILSQSKEELRLNGEL